MLSYFAIFRTVFYLTMTKSFATIFRTVALYLVFTATVAAQTAPSAPSKTPLVLNAGVYAPAPFLAHSGTGAFDNYLAMNLPFAPVETLWKALEKALGGVALKNRGEAHITVVAPPEFTSVLSKVLTMQEINEIATSLKIQSARFTPLCVGRAQVTLEGKMEQTYYVVVQSEDLVNIRRAVFRKYCEKGGEPSLWDPQHYYPHITVGFTKQDLHEESNGVRKGVNSYFLDIAGK